VLSWTYILLVPTVIIFSNKYVIHGEGIRDPRVNIAGQSDQDIGSVLYANYCNYLDILSGITYLPINSQFIKYHFLTQK